MIQEYQLRILPEIAANEQLLKEYLVKEKGLNLRNITATRILKRSIDARQRTIFVNLKVRIYLNEMPTDDEYEHTIYNNVEGKPQVIVVGAGPGGLFAALRLIELGMRPVIVERGKDVREKKKDLAQISREHLINPESNYSFGEGGAGAYSDGKLYTRSKKRGNVDKILNVFCQHGASTAILADAHPHIGTDKLPRVIENMRNTIIECGGEVHFQTRMDALIIKNNEVKGIETNTGKTFLGPVILATGHSARDVYRWLAANNVTIEAKGIAVYLNSSGFHINDYTLYIADLYASNSSENLSGNLQQYITNGSPWLVEELIGIGSTPSIEITDESSTPITTFDLNDITNEAITNSISVADITYYNSNTKTPILSTKSPTIIQAYYNNNEYTIIEGFAIGIAFPNPNIFRSRGINLFR